MLGEKNIVGTPIYIYIYIYILINRSLPYYMVDTSIVWFVLKNAVAATWRKKIVDIEHTNFFCSEQNISSPSFVGSTKSFVGITKSS